MKFQCDACKKMQKSKKTVQKITPRIADKAKNCGVKLDKMDWICIRCCLGIYKHGKPEKSAGPSTIALKRLGVSDAVIRGILKEREESQKASKVADTKKKNDAKST